MTARPTILLFDIDCTLIDNGGAGRRAMLRGLEACHPGSSGEWLDFSLGGLTDKLIVAEALRRTGHEGAPVEPVLAAYLAALEQELEAGRESMRPRYCIPTEVSERAQRSAM